MKPFRNLRTEIQDQGEKISGAIDLNSAVMLGIGLVAILALVIALRAVSD